jgi:biopolymer transport protein ExbD
MLRTQIRKSFVKKTAETGEMSLQITSMADIFMIILVFLLKTFSSGSVDVHASPGVQMPLAVAEGQGADALKLEVSENGVLVAGQPAAAIRRFVFDGKDLLASGASRSLSDALGKQREKALQPDARILVLADQRAPYSTIKAVLASAALNGYTDFKLAVVNPN